MTRYPYRSLVTVFGGSGFLGRYAVRALAQSGFRIRVAVRRPDLAYNCSRSAASARSHAVQANLRYPDSVMRAADGADRVINLVGVLLRARRAALRRGAGRRRRQRRAQPPRQTAPRLSIFPRSAPTRNRHRATRARKPRAKTRCCEAVPDAVILRPSIVFGPEDDFFNRFATHGAHVARCCR